jgi:hypothetical protein
MSHLNLNLHVTALKNSIAFLSGRKDATIEIRIDAESYYNLQTEYMMEDLTKPFIIDGVTILPVD